MKICDNKPLMNIMTKGSQAKEVYSSTVLCQVPYALVTDIMSKHIETVCTLIVLQRLSFPDRHTLNL